MNRKRCTLLYPTPLVNPSYYKSWGGLLFGLYVMLNLPYNDQMAANIKAQQMIAVHKVLGRRDAASLTTVFTSVFFDVLAGVTCAFFVVMAGVGFFVVGFFVVGFFVVGFFVVAFFVVAFFVVAFFVVVVVIFVVVGILPVNLGSKHLHSFSSLQFFIAEGPLQQSETPLNLSQPQPSLLLPGSQLSSPSQFSSLQALLTRADLVVVGGGVVVPGTLQMGSSPANNFFKSVWAWLK